MNCYNHPERNAVITCPQCGKGLCSECANIYSNHLCHECYKSAIKAYKWQNIQGLIGFVILGGLGWYCGGKMSYELFQDHPTVPLTSKLLYGYLTGSVWYGWSFINKFQPFRLTSANIFIWLLYFGLKGILSIYSGVFIAPFYLYKNIHALLKK